MNAALTVATFAVFAVALLVLGAAAAAGPRVAPSARRAAREAAREEQHLASLAACDGLEQAAGARDPLALARESAARLAAALASRLGERHAAVAWCDEIARRLGADDELERRLSGRPRERLMRLDDWEETRTLARLVGSCLMLHQECADVGREQLAARLGMVPLGIAQDFVAGALRWGELVITHAPAHKPLAR